MTFEFKRQFSEVNALLEQVIDRRFIRPATTNYMTLGSSSQKPRKYVIPEVALPKTDESEMRVWLKIANAVGGDSFFELYEELADSEDSHLLFIASWASNLSGKPNVVLLGINRLILEPYFRMKVKAQESSAGRGSEQK